jgi:phosphatidylglycerol:prolipoprotein diacylglycerol transferase
MFINNFDPVAFEVFSLEIRWYSLAYIFGIVLGWIYCKKKLIKDPIILDLFDDFITYLIIGIILGGRIGYALFYNFSYYINNPLEILMVWNGGMSFHGGLIGIILSIYLFSIKYNIRFFYLSDLVSLVAPIGLFLGRISNFINTELYGRVTDFPFAIIYPLIDNNPRHPSQLYEAMFEGVILLLILFMYFNKKPKEYFIGNISALFLIFYSIFRFLIEYLREPDYHLGLVFYYFSMGQILCIPLFIAGLVILFRK